MHEGALAPEVRYLLALGVSLLVILLVVGSIAALQSALILDRESILRGQVWRLLTGHFVHVDMVHLTTNLAGASVVALWAWRAHYVGPILLFVAICAPILGILLLMLGANWYAGLSGILHGAIVLLILQLPIKLRIIGIALVLIKLVWQTWFGGSEALLSSGAPVSLASHWLGAGLGLGFYLACRGIGLRGLAPTERRA